VLFFRGFFEAANLQLQPWCRAVWNLSCGGNGIRVTTSFGRLIGEASNFLLGMGNSAAGSLGLRWFGAGFIVGVGGRRLPLKTKGESAGPAWTALGRSHPASDGPRLLPQFFPSVEKLCCRAPGGAPFSWSRGNFRLLGARRVAPAGGYADTHLNPNREPRTTVRPESAVILRTQGSPTARPDVRARVGSVTHCRDSSPPGGAENLTKGGARILTCGKRAGQNEVVYSVVLEDNPPPDCRVSATDA